ncbi:hypothetical protein CHO01_21740 [Cellulomonas hominis]|uniref:ParB/Sulfiredoxin domain-containing protein n=1 Tax=Cellulomonas hominis TaxID=156981 RepID=A0A511FGS6_9CELL|nr:hypothetical protein [Cellulomonas hominis]MBB5474703.1 hypothetical protein [Cellulomonas hominis]NKY05768.1 hypothetical protein [Cellulomonas hominis]GEL47058.1 hypothetical protein CHO01_21740 [Cellulomonas hominis]
MADLDADGLLTVPLDRFLELICNPLADDPWGVGPITAAEVWAEIEQPTEPDHGHRADEWCHGCEVRRVAHFVANGVPELDDHPICVDIGLRGYTPRWPLVDGNHRVAALAVLGSPTVRVAVVGDVDKAIAWLT